MVTWFAGLFYLRRLFVYHSVATDAVGRARFKVMERKLFWGIMTPGMVLTLACGGAMLWGYAWQAYGRQGWLHAKLLLLALLVLYHGHCGYLVRQLARDRNPHGHVWYRLFNEVPVLFLVGIVLLAVLRPF